MNEFTMIKIVKRTDVLSGKNPFAYQEIVKNIKYTCTYDSFRFQIVFVKDFDTRMKRFTIE